MHPLAIAYQEAIQVVPDELHVRRALDEEAAKVLTGGHHVLVRGFWRTGKTEMLKAALKGACERTGGAAFYFDLRDPERDDGLPADQASVLARLKTKVDTFIQRVGATGLTVDPKRPLLALGELAAPLFVGIDEAIALKSLGPELMRSTLIDLLETPKNVKVVLVGHRHRDADALFEEITQRASVDTVFVPPIDDEELVHIVTTPARAHGITWSEELLGGLAQVSGNRPWEVFTFAHLIARKLPDDFKGELKVELLDPLLDLDALTEVEEGQALVNNMLRILATAMTESERTLVDLLATGGEGEAPEDAIESLQRSAYLEANEQGFALRGSLFEGIARSVATGEIRVKVE